MDSANFIDLIKNPNHLHQISFQELNSLIEAYPYCQNLHFLAMMKAKIEQHKDYNKRLALVATYCADRQFLFKQIQEPTQPESNSDSYNKIAQENQSGKEPTVDAQSASGFEFFHSPPSPLDEMPKKIQNLQSEAPKPTSDKILTPEFRVVEDESGSQLILKNADMELPPEKEKRKVVFLEDLFLENEIVKEVPDQMQNRTRDEEVPIDSVPPVINEPEIEYLEEEESPLEEEDVFAAEPESISDDHLEIPITDADNLSDRLELHDLPQGNQEESNSPDIPSEELGEENEFIEFPDHILDNIPFEITNLSDEKSKTFDDLGESSFMEDEAFSEVAPKENLEQNIGFTVVKEKIEMNAEEEDELEDSEKGSSNEEDDNEKANEEAVKNKSDEMLLSPLPKNAFKSWLGKYKTTAKYDLKEQNKIEEIEEEAEEQRVKLVEDEITESIDLTKVIKKSKSSKPPKTGKGKVKKKKKSKKEKKTKKEKNEPIDVESKKARKAKAKKRKKKKIKRLAEKSLRLKDDIISETLATLLVDQGSNKKAIKMYKKLSLIFPEKSAFFASQIKKLKN